jgi:hypothetical protein
MALTKDTTAQSLLASTSNSAGGTTNSSAITVGYGCSIIATITNGGTGPTVACTATLQVSADNSTWYSTDDARPGSTTNSGVYTFKFDLGVGGVDGGDWKYARIQFSGNTGQAVTVSAVGSSTSAV